MDVDADAALPRPRPEAEPRASAPLAGAVASLVARLKAARAGRCGISPPGVPDLLVVTARELVHGTAVEPAGTLRAHAPLVA